MQSPGLVYYRSNDLGVDFCLGLDLAMLPLLLGCAKIRFKLVFVSLNVRSLKKNHLPVPLKSKYVDYTTKSHSMLLS